MPRPVVDHQWLRENLEEVRVVDSRWYLDGRSGRDAYEAGHIPGAVWADVDRDLSAVSSDEAGRHPLPTPQHFAGALARLGIDDRTAVVVYDDAGGSIAARLWWMLHVLDHPVAVLDGGVATWDGPLEHGWRSVAPRHFTPRPWPADRLADADDVDRLRVRAQALLLDARASARYAHGDPSIDPRPGHIPGAKSAPWAENLSPDGQLRDPAALRERFLTLGAADAETVVCYCGSGITACHDLLALEIAGFGDRTVLYPGSWSQWGADHTRPTATGTNSGTDDASSA